MSYRFSDDQRHYFAVLWKRERYRFVYTYMEDVVILPEHVFCFKDAATAFVLAKYIASSTKAGFSALLEYSNHVLKLPCLLPWKMPYGYVKNGEWHCRTWLDKHGNAVLHEELLRQVAFAAYYLDSGLSIEDAKIYWELSH